MKARTLLATLAAVGALAACTPEPPPPTPPIRVAPQVASACDVNHTPNNNRSWCMVWTRLKDGVKVNPGPYWEYQFDASHGGARVIVWPTYWRSAP